MKKTQSITLFAAAILMMITGLNAFAQSDAPKLEVGVQYSVLRLKPRLPINNPILEIVDPDYVATDSGFGGRLTYNLTNHISVEGEINFFPEERNNFAEPFYLDSRRTQGLFGVKAGTRSDKIGIFGKVRPGFMHFGEGVADPRIQTLVAIPATVSTTEFALDVGGVFELYPSRHTMLRFDLGDT
ncbi:MAG: outer membrane beta-barrel protein, partial [Acidobacteriota bacterium]